MTALRALIPFPRSYEVGPSAALLSVVRARGGGGGWGPRACVHCAPPCCPAGHLAACLPRWAWRLLPRAWALRVHRSHKHAAAAAADAEAEHGGGGRPVFGAGGGVGGAGARGDAARAPLLPLIDMRPLPGGPS